ncbi:MAG: bifunctional diguanylate cyclase/phosphodiesterase [Pseudomonadota bacterium]
MKLGAAKVDRQLLEILGVGGLASGFLFFELQFGLVDLLTGTLFSSNPGLKTYSIAIFGAMFVGLAVFSMTQRLRARSEATARRDVEENFKQFQVADQATGLPNRLGFQLVFDELLEAARVRDEDTHFAILAVHLRNLDTLRSIRGLEVSQQLEMEIANYLVSLAAPDDFVAHGDFSMFYLFVSGNDEDDVQFRVDQIVESVVALAKSGVPTETSTIPLHVNFGIFGSPSLDKISPPPTAEKVLQRVDYATHHARSRGRYAFSIFDEHLDAAITKRAMVEGDLPQAIANKNIIPYFQPFIDLKANKVTGFEVLARWEHPHAGIIMPAAFIPSAEESGILPSLTLSVLEQACIAAQNWPRDISLAINISPTDLRSEALLSGFLDVLRRTGMESRRIEVEITENAFIEEAGDISNAISQLKEMGVTISIDDFGTGFSSLHHLRVLPFDKIKIDQSFIRDMATNSESRKIVQTIIALGQSLGLPTTAEGIELEQNRELLQELGCSIGQGYLYAKPLKAEDVLAFLNSFEEKLKQVA